MKYILYLVVFTIISVSAVLYINFEYDSIRMEKATKAEIVFNDALNLKNFNDGIYVGKDEYVTLEVEVANHNIVSIEILKNKPGDYAASAEKVTDRVISAQNLDVDTISGATTTSKKILSAISSALSSEKDVQSGGDGEANKETGNNSTDVLTSASSSWNEEGSDSEVTPESTPNNTEKTDMVTSASQGWDEPEATEEATEDTSTDAVTSASQVEETSLNVEVSETSIDATTGASQSF